MKRYVTCMFLTRLKEEGTDPVWIQNNIHKLKAKIRANGVIAQAQIREKIYLLTAEADYISQYLAKNTIQL